MATLIKFESPENAAVAAASHYPVRPDEAVDWSCGLFDSDGIEHRLVALGGVQVVTKASFAFAIWNRRTGECVSHDEYLSISNQPLSDVEKTKRRAEAVALYREAFERPRSG